MKKLIIALVLLAAAGYVLNEYFVKGGTTMLGNAKAAQEVGAP